MSIYTKRAKKAERGPLKQHHHHLHLLNTFYEPDIVPSSVYVWSHLIPSVALFGNSIIIISSLLRIWGLK